jgi:putative CocE/NonD family hydrolase
MVKTKWLRADLRYCFDRCKGLFNKSIYGSISHIPTGTKDVHTDVLVDKNLSVQMRDGVVLYADIYRPAAPGRFPTVLIRMPYGKQESFCYMPTMGRYWARKGYACVIQDVRGKWGSGGSWKPFINERDDGYDTISWVVAQNWSDGKVGMTGESYYGYTQLAAAVSQHPNLVCIAPGDTAANIFGVWAYNSHAFCLQTMGIWCPETNSRTYANFYRLNRWKLPLVQMDEDAGLPCDYFKEWIRRPLRDQYWDTINLDQHYSRITIPVLSWGGWYDTFLKGTIDDWTGIREAAKKAGTERHQHLLISGTDHEVTPMFTGRIGRQAVSSDVFSYDLIQAFFEGYMKGIENGFADKTVQLFVTGANKWRTEKEWPIPNTDFTKFYLHSSGSAATALGDGSLSLEPPKGEEPYDQFVYDPADPVAVAFGENLWRRADCMTDRKQVEERPDVLCYTSAPLTAGLEVVGPLKAHITASSSAVDTDFTVALVDVFPDGYCHLVQEGIVRARFRQPEKGAQLLIPGQKYGFDVDMWALGHEFQCGHRIRIEVSSSNFDKYDRNLNNGDLPGCSDTVVVATQRVFHGAGEESYIILPVQPSGQHT